MANTDRIDIPVGFQITQDIRELLADVKRQAQAELKKTLREAEGGGIPVGKHGATFSRQFESGGRIFEIQGRTRAKRLSPKELKDLGEEVTEENVYEFVSRIKEIKGKVKEQFSADAKRLDVLKRSIRHQPDDIQEQAIKDYLNTFPDVNNELTNRLQKLARRRERKRFSSTKQESYTRGIEEQIKAQEALEQLGGESALPARNEIARLKGLLAKSKFRDVRLGNVSRSFEEQIQMIEQYKTLPDALQREADAELIRIKNKRNDENLRRIKRDEQERQKIRRERFKETRRTTATLEPSEALTQWENYKKQADALQQEADIEIRKIKKGKPVSDLRNKMRGRSPLEQIEIIKQAQAEGVLQLEEANGMLRQLSHRFVQQIKSNKRPDVRRIEQLKQEIRFQPEDIQEQLIKDHLNQFADINNELTNRLQKLTRRRERRRFTSTKQESFTRSIEEQIKAQEAIVSLGGESALPATNEIARLRRKLEQFKFRSLKSNISIKPLEEQIQLLEDYSQQPHALIQESQTELSRLRSRLSRRIGKETKLSISSHKLEDQIDFWQNIDPASPLAAESGLQLTRLREKLRRRTFKQTKTSAAILDLDAAIKEWENYKQQQNAFSQEADVEIAKLRRSKSRSDLRSRMRGRSPADQIQMVKDAQLAGLLEIEEANGLLRQLSAKFVQQTRRTRKGRFTDWTKHLQTLDPADAIAQLDAYINRPISRFVDDARIMRQRILRGQQNNANRMAQERARRFSNMMMLASGTGLGLFGAAGFPLLNIGFAAMSSGGNPLGVGVVAAATAIGELSRRINEMKTNAVEAAKSIGFVSTQYKVEEARNKSFDAFMGAGALGVEQAYYRQRIERFKQMGKTGLEANEVLESYIKSFSVSKDRIISGDVNQLMFGGLISFNREAIKLRNEAEKNRPENIRSAYRNMLAEFNKPYINLQEDPYQMWMRIQASALDPAKSEERKIQQEAIKEMKGLVDALNDNTQAQTGNSGVLGNKGMNNYFFGGLVGRALFGQMP